MKKLLNSSIVLLLLCGNIAGCAPPLNVPQINQSDVSFAADYDSIYDALFGIRGDDSFYTDSRLVFSIGAGVTATPAVSTVASVNDSLADYSGTNVQVAGIDEGDIVKTDGIHIYSLQNGQLSIFRADGANTSPSINY